MAGEANKDSSAQSAADNGVLRPKKEWPRRLAGTVAVLALIWLLAGLILTLKNDWVNKQLIEWRDQFYDWCGDQGMVLQDIIISGRERTTKQEIMQALGLDRGANMLKIDVYRLKEQLESLPWVKEASVRRGFLPNVLMISVEEKQVKAIWQLNEKFYPLDAEGKVVDADFRVSEPILLIVGAGAPENFAALFAALKEGGENYLPRIKVANFISGRRWNLILDDIRGGVTVKLPEENIGEAWKKLVKLDETKGIFKRKLTIIDLRLPDKIVVKLRREGKGKPPKLTPVVEHKL